MRSTAGRPGLALLMVCGFTALSCHTAEPVRLAIVTGDESMTPAVDVLTAAFSTNTQLALVERAQIDKVIAEQSLTAANGADALKLGQLLGADGLLLLEPAREGTNGFLASRLIAVKPGVVIDAMRVGWPVPDIVQWSAWMERRLNPLFPKLGVLPKDAVPVSVVNLRSAFRSREAEQLERQLTLLTIDRLSRERQLFVLERRQMQLLTGEKELKGMGESEFWNGSYLLEGVIDRDGFSPEKVTLSVRLAPPKGGAQVNIEVSGSRTNLAEVVTLLTTRVLEALKLGTGATSWNPDEEANQYFEEAKWARKWKMFRQAQSAAESAWALGRHDQDCATVRLESYVLELMPGIRSHRPGTPLRQDWFQHGQYFTSNRKPDVATVVRELRADYPMSAGIAVVEHANYIESVFALRKPDVWELEAAERALRLYYEFSRTLPDGEPTVGSPWNRLGIQVLTAGSVVLQHFHLVPEAQSAVAGRLAELRASCRTVAEWISKSPSVSGSYWIGSRSIEEDELARTLGDGWNIFRCKMDLGCLWQDKPEECVTLYRELMTSAAFGYIHSGLWDRPVECPRLVAWDPGDRARLERLWQDFLGELEASTNQSWRFEGKFIAVSTALTEKQAEDSCEALFAMIFSNREALVSTDVELLRLASGIQTLLENYGGGQLTPTKERLTRRFYAEVRPRLEVMNNEYRAKILPQQRSLYRFEEQRRYLTNNTPFEFSKFAPLFLPPQVSKDQAAELLPLLSNYRSNLIAQPRGTNGTEAGYHRIATNQLRLVESQLKNILNASPAVATTQVQAVATAGNIPNRSPTARPGPQRPAVEPPDPNALTIGQFSRIPRMDDEPTHQRDPEVYTHRWRDGRLWVGLGYGRLMGSQANAAAAAWNPQNGSWEVFKGPDDRIGGDFELFDGALYWISGWWEKMPSFNEEPSATGSENRTARVTGPGLYQTAHELKKYDLKIKQWETLEFPGQKLSSLTAVNGRLFALSDESIIEILDNGKRTRILASSRRRPAASSLDTMENLGVPTLLAGPDNSIGVAVRDKICIWNGQDWSTRQEMPVPVTGDFQSDGVVLRSSYRNRSQVWLLPRNQLTAQLCVDEVGAWAGGGPADPPRFPPAKWKPAGNLRLTAGAVAVAETNLYVFTAYNREARTSSERWTLEEKDGRHGNLVLLDQRFAKPFVLPIRFDLTRSPFTDKERGLMGAGRQPWWINVTPNQLVIGKANAPGIWTVPRNEIDSAFEVIMRQQKDERALRLASAAGPRKAIMSRYDHNQNGIFDPDEKEEAIDDPVFIELELDSIDVDQNNLLDPEELAWFDANRNGILDSKEQAGIDIALRLMAARLIPEFDTDGNGTLDRTEFMVLAGKVRSGQDQLITAGPIQDFRYFDANNNGGLDSSELSLFLLRQTRQTLGGNGPRRIFAGPGGPRANDATLFKTELEAYWKRQGP